MSIVDNTPSKALDFARRVAAEVARREAAGDVLPRSGVNAEQKRTHDNITHALRAIFANETRYLLTAPCVRAIAYGVTGRNPDAARKRGGWNTAFARLATDDPKGERTVVREAGGGHEVRTTQLWYRCDSFGIPVAISKIAGFQDALEIPATGKKGVAFDSLDDASRKRLFSKTQYWRLTDAGRERLLNGMMSPGALELAQYDAFAWLKDAQSFAFRTPHWWLRPENHDTVFVDSDALNLVAREKTDAKTPAPLLVGGAEHLGFGDFRFRTAVGDVEAIRDEGLNEVRPAEAVGRSHHLHGTPNAIRLFLLAIERNTP